MFRVVPYRPWHLRTIRAQPRQMVEVGVVLANTTEVVAHAGPCFTALKDRRPVCCAGLVMLGAHRAIAWAVLAKTGPGTFLRVHRAVRSFLDDVPVRRIEALVEGSFDDGHRWVRLLGFKCETPGGMVKWDEDGRTWFLYARVKGE